MKIAIAQINCTVGDLAGNVSRILDFVSRARAQSADILITPELAICGYPPEDLLLRDDFYRDCEAALARLVAGVSGITVVVGHPRQSGHKRYNAASVIRDGRIVATYHKHALPNYTVFDEQRYFEPGDSACVFEAGGIRFGINICEDTWGRQGPSLANPGPDGRALDLGETGNGDAHAPKAARDAGAEVLLVLNASPYHVRKQDTRYEVMRRRVAEFGMPIIYANMVGGQDELVFDGASFALDARGTLTNQLPMFEEALGFVALYGTALRQGDVANALTPDAEVYSALRLGVRDYVGKNGFPGVLLGLSGGIDSAVTLAIAADAIGPSKVHAVMMPSQYTADISQIDAREEAEKLGVRYSEIAIKPVFDVFMATLADQFKGLAADTA